MSRLLMSAAIAALMSAPAMAQADPAMALADNISASTEAAGDAADWKTSHAWINAAVYDEAGDQVGIVNRVRLNDSDDGVRALVLDTGGFLDKGMRHVSLLSDEATVITRDALPASWMVTHEGPTGAPGEPASDGDTTTERSWWEFGREDDDAGGDPSAMPNFTLITLDFTAYEIAMMPQFTAGSSSHEQPEARAASTASSADEGRADASAGLTSVSDDESDAADDAAADESRNDGRGPSTASTDVRVALVTNDEREAAASQRASMNEDAAKPDMPATNESANPFSLAWTDVESAMDRRTGISDEPVVSEAGWTDDNTLVGQDVYAQDDTRLGAVSRVRQDGPGLEAEPVTLIIITDTMGERSVSLEGRDWSSRRREGVDALTLDYQDRGEFEQNSAPYSAADRLDDGESDTPEWTDQHDWVNTAVYSRSGEKIGEIERVRGGAGALHPRAIVLETGGFLDIGGREVELSGSNFRLTDYEGEQVLQIRYTQDEIMQMPTFDEAGASDYLLSDNPLEVDETETGSDDDETESGGTR
ncbi:PRC-barrel domain-containing protein [Maricaulaceae bacterium MS644]